MAQSTTFWKLSEGLSPASSASELGLQKEGWAASLNLHHEMEGWSQPCVKLYTVPTQTFPCMAHPSTDTPLWFIKMTHPYILLSCCRLGKKQICSRTSRDQEGSCPSGTLRWVQMQAKEHLTPCRWLSHQKRSSCLGPTMYLIWRAPGPAGTSHLSPAFFLHNHQWTGVTLWHLSLLRWLLWPSGAPTWLGIIL